MSTDKVDWEKVDIAHHEAAKALDGICAAWVTESRVDLVKHTTELCAQMTALTAAAGGV